MYVDVAGVRVDAITKQQALKKIDELIQSGKPSLAVTTYSEFIVFAHKHPEYKKVLNAADLSLAEKKLNFRPRVSLAEGLRLSLANDPRFRSLRS